MINAEKTVRRTFIISSAAVLYAGLFASVAAGGTPDLASCDSWMPAASANYTASSRPGSYPIQYVVIHKAEGTAAGAASWFQNAAAGESAHYIFSNSSGYCYQSVREKNIAWHADNWNRNTVSIGLFHGGYSSLNDTSSACYAASGQETKSCIVYYDVQWNRNSIIGHNEIPGSLAQCPGPFWDWAYYMTQCSPFSSAPHSYINDNPVCSKNWQVGTTASDKYGPDYRWRTTDAVNDPASWTINVPTGNYDISAWWIVGSNRNPSAGYVLPGGVTVVRNQQVNGGMWNVLGTRLLSGGNQTTLLTCYGPPGYIVIADAVRYYGPK